MEGFSLEILSLDEKSYQIKIFQWIKNYERKNICSAKDVKYIIVNKNIKNQKVDYSFMILPFEMQRCVLA